MLESTGYAHNGELSGCDDPGLYEAAHRRANIFSFGGAGSLRPHERKWGQKGGVYSCHARPQSFDDTPSPRRVATDRAGSDCAKREAP